MSLTLAHELLLLAIHDDKGTLVVEDSTLSYALTGALLVELILAEQARLIDKLLVLSGETPHPDPFVEEARQLILTDKKPQRKMKDWVQRLPDKLKKLRVRMTEDLVEKGILRHEEGRILWVFPHHTYPTGNPSPELEIRSRIRNVVLGGSAPDERTAALIGLCEALEMRNKLFEKHERKAAKSRMKEIAKGEFAGQAVSGAVEEAMAAVAGMVVIMAATTTVSS